MHSAEGEKPNESREKHEKGTEEAEEPKRQVSTNGQWRVTAGARTSAGAWTAEIFTRRTEWETRSLQISWSSEGGRESEREREKDRASFSCLLTAASIAARAVKRTAPHELCARVTFCFYLFSFARTSWTFAWVCFAGGGPTTRTCRDVCPCLPFVCHVYTRFFLFAPSRTQANSVNAEVSLIKGGGVPMSHWTTLTVCFFPQRLSASKTWGSNQQAPDTS